MNRYRLLLQAFCLLVVARLGLWLFPYRRLLAWASGVGRSRRGATVEQVVEAINTMKAFVPGATCLTQALVAARQLRSMGIDVELRVGVARRDDGELEFHAWVERDGRIVLGERPDMGRYLPFTN